MDEHQNNARHDSRWAQNRDAQNHLDGQHGVQVLQPMGTRDPLCLRVVVHVRPLPAIIQKIQRSLTTLRYYSAGTSGTFDNQRTHVLKGSAGPHMGVIVELRWAHRDPGARRVGNRLDGPRAPLGQLSRVFELGRCQCVSREASHVHL
jgi:hypothetical protein